MPILRPIGGHAIYVDASKMLPQIPREEYPAQLLGVELYIEGDIRGVEIGTLLADRDPETGADRFPKLELLRLAIPRRVYSQAHMDYVASALVQVHHRSKDIRRGLRIVKEAPLLRHFTVQLERL